MSNKILVVSNTPFFGGGETFVASILSKIDNTDFLVRDELLANKLAGKSVFMFKSDNLFLQYKQIRQHIIQNKIDIVILNGGSTIYFAPFLIDVKKIIFRHSTNRAYGTLVRKYLAILVLHTCYAFSDKIIHVSEFSRKEQLLFRGKSLTIHNGVLSSINKRSGAAVSKKLKLLYLGRTDESKGLKDIISIVQQYNNTKVELHIVGSGPLDSWIKEQCNDQIIFHGFQTETDAFYQNSDILILLSEFENCPFTIIEAMRNGVPTIAKPVGGIPELIDDNKSGFLVSSTEDVFRVIDYLLTNNEFMTELENNCYIKYLKEFTIDRCLGEIYQIVQIL